MAKRRALLSPGTTVDDYEVVEVMRAQWPFEVAMARRRGSDETVVLKCLGADAEDDLDLAGLLVDEALLLTRLDHPNIRRCVGVVRQPVTQVLETIDGGTLSGYLLAVPTTTGRAFSCARALYMAHEISRALCYLRPRGVVHTDVTPHNVLIDRAGRVTLIDFTFGHWPQKRFVHPLWPMPEKLSYNTPEQWARTPADQATPAADVYQLGLTLWAVLAGREPELAAKAKRGAPLPRPGPLSRIRQDVPKEVLDLLDELLALEPSARPVADEALCERLMELARQLDPH